MALSKNRFQEIVSSYLDGEATNEELRLLVSAIRENPEFANIFYENCRIYMASCKIYGKKPKFAPLPVVEVLPEKEKESPKQVALEWIAVFSLMLTSIAMFYASSLCASENVENATQNTQYYSNLYDTKTTSEISGNSHVCGYVKFSTKAKVILPEKAPPKE